MVKIKRVLACLLALFILVVSSCSSEPVSNEIVPPESPPTSDTVPEQEPPEVSKEPPAGVEDSFPEEPEELPFEYILDPDFDRSSGIYLYDDRYSEENLTFDLNELAAPMVDLSPGKWTINEIEEKYGKPEEIYGNLEFNNTIEIIIKYAEMKIVLNTIRNGELSFDTDSNPVDTRYPLSEEDKDVRMWLQRVLLCSPLPRGLIAGESTIEQVKAAYPPDSGREYKQEEHILAFSYVDFDKLAISTKNKKPDIVSFIYSFKEGVLNGARKSFKVDLYS